jgi:V/A-type H+-transporting ATPase subunit F
MYYYFIGDEELLTAFRFAGVDGEAAQDAAQAQSAFQKITGGAASAPEYRILILTEQISIWLGGALTEWQLSGRYPLVVELPGIHGHIPGRKTLIDSIREAIGINV